MAVVVPMVVTVAVFVVVIMRVAMRMGIFHILRSYYLPAGYGTEPAIFLAIILPHGNKAIDDPAIRTRISRMVHMRRDHVYRTRR